MRIRPLHIVLAGMLASFGTVHATEIIENDQDDNRIGNAPVVTFSGDTLVIKGVIGNVRFPKRPDLDYYKFLGQDGDVVTVDIDDGWGGDAVVNTIVALFADDDNKTVLEQSGDVKDDQPVDEGSDHRFDPRIDEYRLPYTGFYIVGVSSDPYKQFVDGGNTWPAFSRFRPGQQNGDYTLVISGVSSPVLNINIEIKPNAGATDTVQSAKAGKSETGGRPLNHKSQGKIPVALLSSFEFNPLLVDQDPESLTFGRTGEEQSLSHCPSRRDVNRDGRLDLVCMFDAATAGFEPDDTSGFVRGKTVDGKPFKGRSAYQPVPRGR